MYVKVEGSNLSRTTTYSKAANELDDCVHVIWLGLVCHSRRSFDTFPKVLGHGVRAKRQSLIIRISGPLPCTSFRSAETAPKGFFFHRQWRFRTIARHRLRSLCQDFRALQGKTSLCYYQSEEGYANCSGACSLREGLAAVVAERSEHLVVLI